MNILQEVDEEPVYKAENEDEYEELEIAVDSGASDNVIGESMLKTHQTLEGKKSKLGGPAKYSMADGSIQYNQVQKVFMAETDTGLTGVMAVQIIDGCETALWSVTKLMDAGHQVVYHSDGSYIVNKETGTYANMHRKGGMMFVKLHTRKPRGQKEKAVAAEVAGPF